MNHINKLRTAAKMIEKSNPELSAEILKTAQSLETSMNEFQGGQKPDMGMNPNIQTFAQPGQSAEQRELHKITIQLDVPVGTNELDIMNNLLPNLRQLEDKDYKLKGYAFDERTRG